MGATTTRFTSSSFETSETSIKQQIINTIRSEATHAPTGTKAPITVFSDVDDTLYSSGGKWPAGCDNRLPKHVHYPGCLAFFRTIMSSHCSDEDESKYASTLSMTHHAPTTGDLVFLSACPHAYKDAAETKSYEAFRQLVNDDKLDFHPILLPGQLPASLRSASERSFLGPSRGKARDFKNIRRLTSMLVFTLKNASFFAAIMAKQITTWRR